MQHKRFSSTHLVAQHGGWIKTDEARAGAGEGCKSADEARAGASCIYKRLK